MNQEFEGRVAFCVGTGRCGTTFISEVARLEPTVAASHERLRLGATIHMFSKWHHLPIDSEGFLLDREEAVRADLSSRSHSFECSALLSHSLEELHERFHARFVLLVRSPAETVASFAVRGWFLKIAARSDFNLPPSYREGEEPRHFFGRNIPHGTEFERWGRLTQIGKIAWFWKARNSAILDQFSRFPSTHYRIQRLEDLSFEGYRELAAFLGWESEVTPQQFADLAQARLNSGPNLPRKCSDWTDQEAAEFEGEVHAIAERLGYEYRIDRLR